MKSQPYPATPETLSQAEIEWIAPLRYERGEPVARRVGMHKRLVDAKRISPAQYEWCEAYIDALECLQGAYPGKPLHELPEPRGEPIYSRPVKAAAFVRRAHQDITPRQRDLLLSAVVMAYRVADCAIVIGLHPRDTETMAGFARRVDADVRRYVIVAIERASGLQPKSEEHQINR